jgi:hypothetical protein
MRTPSLSTAILFVSLADPAFAVKAPAGPPFQVNTLLGTQPGDFHGPDVAGAADGRFVVVWEDRYGYQGIYLRRYDADGIPLGNQFRVDPTGYGTSPAVASDPSGNFVIVWEDYGGGNGILGQRFDAAGAAQGPSFVVHAPGYPSNPKVGVDGAGNFVVVWFDYDSGFFIRGRRFDASGTALGGEFQVNTDTSQSLGYNGIDEDPDGIEVAANSAGTFMVVWQHYEEDGDNFGISGRLFDATGAALTPDFQLNTYTSGDQNYPGIAADGLGRFIVSWGGDGPPGAGPLLRRFDSSGTPLDATEFRVPAAGYAVYGGKVAADAAGEFVVVWEGPDYTIYEQRFDANALPLDAGSLVTPTTGYHTEGILPAVASKPNGDFVVVWMERYGGETDLFGQRFAESGSCTPAPKSGCRSSVVPHRGVFRFSEGTTDERDQLVWQWDRGADTTVAALGDPFTSTGYAFCVYDGSGNPQPILAVPLAVDGACGAHPCWRPLNAGRIEYNDRTGTIGGITRLRLVPGADRFAHVTVLAKGPTLDLPDLPLTTPVVVQVQATNDTCFTASFDARVTANANGRFRGTP